MLIRDLEKEYPLVYKAALVNAVESGCEKGTDLVEAFVWSDTEEDHDFWYCIEHGRIEEAKKLCPELFVRDFEEGLPHQILKEYPACVFKDSTFSFMIENQGDSVLKIVEQEDGYLITKL
jgi:hypothetical protein